MRKLEVNRERWARVRQELVAIHVDVTRGFDSENKRYQ